ncbi:MAG: tyrosine-type recombinase/integrase, partial [Planctomycetota bacterium]
MSTRELIGRWVAHNRQVFTPGTCKLYSRVIWRFAQFLPADARNINVEHIDKYVAHLLEKEHLSRRSVNSQITAIKSFFRWLHETYEIPNEAAKFKVLKCNPPKRRFISPEEYEKILGVCQDGESKIIKLLYHTGLRAAELQNLQVANIHGRSIRFAGKGRKERCVPLSKTAYQCICENGKPNIDFLESYRKRNAVYALCKKLSRKAGVPVAGPHSYRRFFGNQLRQKGVDIFVISRLYGHSDIATTQMYLDCSG